MNEIQHRIQRAAESILENEALTADLDDTAANELIDWGIILAQQIASQTIEKDETQAEGFMYRPMRALRKMLRAANKWAVDPGEFRLERILKQAAIVYGSRFVQPSDEDQSAFTIQLPTEPSERLIALQRFVGGAGNDQTVGENPLKESDLQSDATSTSGDKNAHIFE